MKPLCQWQYGLRRLGTRVLAACQAVNSGISRSVWESRWPGHSIGGHWVPEGQNLISFLLTFSSPSKRISSSLCLIGIFLPLCLLFLPSLWTSLYCSQFSTLEGERKCPPCKTAVVRADELWWWHQEITRVIANTTMRDVNAGSGKSAVRDTATWPREVAPRGPQRGMCLGESWWSHAKWR